MIKDISQDISYFNLFAIVFEINLVDSNPREWWIDTSATQDVSFKK